ncbi:MAG: bifunctional nuclease family protein [Chloroflexota bacterium]|nr:MAG: bifunctional nuclease family protein [Chloroflexota bacterium]HDD54902.1 bifunctional nuclease family protein [Chloroflexota bacterium]
MSNMIEVVIDSIRVSLMSQQRVVILREINSDRYLPIMVGIYEAEHLTLALQDVEVARPLTYDLFVSILDTLNAEVTHVEVVSLNEETYFGNIVISIGGTLHNIDSRPSDAMNLAIRMGAPIFVAEEVLDEAGLIPEEDLTEISPDEELDSERLSVFENYLEQIDPDPPQEESGEDENDQD